MIEDHFWLIQLGLLALVGVSLVALAIIGIAYHPLFVIGGVALLGLLWCIGWAVEAAQ
jgi:hypothetical protein